ncbi:hypothetical protein I6N96_00800 [Enterococcus sp. BWM-S5]|uniref:Uncharacterized protein n=1 Tax=Enterococcus larvae TaxID=2794352 RepID=A0ABS4CG26_9ENTE|nr:hypothetical protein [Enterococcus larvae]MBP1044799.1 hypothetical protein [Enterococcus larvae]
MNRVVFTRKHIIVASLILVMGVFLSVSGWLFAIEPSRKELGELTQKLKTVKQEITQEEKLLRTVKGLPSLLESDFVTNDPIIPNGIQLQEYFDRLKQLDESMGISFQHVSFENVTIFPELAEGASNTSLKQLQNTTVAFDVLASGEQELLNFVKELETTNRFTKVEQVTYRCNPDSLGEDSYAYSASIVLQMYYLSYAETGRPVE